MQLQWILIMYMSLSRSWVIAWKSLISPVAPSSVLLLTAFNRSKLLYRVVDPYDPVFQIHQSPHALEEKFADLVFEFHLVPK